MLWHCLPSGFVESLEKAVPYAVKKRSMDWDVSNLKMQPLRCGTYRSMNNTRSIRDQARAVLLEQCRPFVDARGGLPSEK